MEVVPTPPIATDEPVPEIGGLTVEHPKEEVKKSQSEQLAENIAKADSFAHAIKAKVLLPEFTIQKMAELMRINRQEAQNKINFISRFGYADDKILHGVVYHQIILDPEQRIKNMEITKAKFEAQWKAQAEYLNSLQEVTATYIKNDNV